MDVWVDFSAIVIQFLVIICSFTFSVYVLKYILPRIQENSFLKSSRFFNPEEYLPNEEIHTMKQVFYLVMIILFAANILYLIFSWSDGRLTFMALDIVLSAYLAYEIEGKTIKDKVLLFFMIPFSSIAYLLFTFHPYLLLFDLIHALAFAYFIKNYYQRFLDYTQANSLGITIMLLFLLVFVSFFITILVEEVSPMDSIEMVSNAITSNGYTVLGKSSLGKFNDLLLVWSGFLLSCVGSATLAASIVMRNVDSKFDRLEELAKMKKKD